MANLNTEDRELQFCPSLQQRITRRNVCRPIKHLSSHLKRSAIISSNLETMKVALYLSLAVSAAAFSQVRRKIVLWSKCEELRENERKSGDLSKRNFSVC